MARKSNKVSVVIPVYNEAECLATFQTSLLEVLRGLHGITFEIVYCDDGSTDATTRIIQKFVTHDSEVRLLRLSRNFGKEIATTAGIQAATGDAVLTLDADGQHPVELISEFIAKWQKGSQVVIGLRTLNQKEGFVKHYGSRLFYQIFNRFTGVKLVPGASDFRLIDKAVQQDFVKMTERNRITRGLIDWLGYKRDYIRYEAKPRLGGKANYTPRKLFKLAVDSVISLSISPLYFSAYLGAIVLPLSTLLGLGMLGNAAVGDPIHLRATGGAYIEVLTMFLIGVLLVSQGIIGLYLSHIHEEAQNRPLYIIDHAHSAGFDES